MNIDRFIRWITILLLGIVILFGVAWLHWRVRNLEVQIAEIHAMTEALVEWVGGTIER